MRLTLLVQGSPTASDAERTALAFARAAVEAGESLHRVFFYKDAIHAANRFRDDQDSVSEWARLRAESGVELAVCIAAAQRRGVVEGESLAEGFEVVGLGQMIEAIESSDRVVTFA